MEAERHQEARPPISLDQAWGSCGVCSEVDRGPSRGLLTEGSRQPVVGKFSLVVLTLVMGGFHVAEWRVVNIDCEAPPRL